MKMQTKLRKIGYLFIRKCKIVKCHYFTAVGNYGVASLNKDNKDQQSVKVSQIFRGITMDDTKTVWCGNLSDQVTEELLYELFLQAGPLERVKIPTDRDGRKSNFAFITFKHEKSVNYVLQLLKGTRLFDRLLIVKQRIGITQNRPLDRNARQPEFQNNTINQLRVKCLPRFDHSTDRLAYNRLNYSGHKRKRIMEDDRLNYNGHKRKKTMSM